ncbi:MAG: carbohydrate ABC transporter permease [Phycisphaerae bacterium]
MRPTSDPIKLNLSTLCHYALLLLLTAVAVMPLVWALLASLRPLDQVYQVPPRWGLDRPQWANYGLATAKLPLLRFIANSLLISVSSVVGAVLTSSMAGYAFARLNWRGKRFWFIVLLASLVVPTQVLLIPRFLIFEALGWVGSYKPLIVPAWLGGGAFNVLLFRQFFLTVPRSYEQAALLDGATPWQIYRWIMLPLSMPVVITAALLSFVYHWQEFLDPLIYLSDFRTYPVSLGLRMFQSMAGTWGNLLMAASILALIPVALLFVVFSRHLGRAVRVGT